MNILETLVTGYLKGVATKATVQDAPKGQETRATKVVVVKAFKRRFDVDLVFRLADDPKAAPAEE